ncbi:MAG: hypothetical protein FGM24_08805 [Candidatus Kapabacteria bacterium]|nr:hypothetical protein [Candidatus Kapabacteria bacterium]
MMRAQEVVISEYMNELQPDAEWTEVVVVKDDLNMVGWFVTDNNGTQSARQGGVKFKDIPMWRHVREGTIIVIRHRGTNAYPGRDADPSDGFLDVGLYDNALFDVASFSGINGAELNIANEGDFLQVLRADTSHVHGLGHRKPTGPAYDGTAAPKANHDTLGVGNGRTVCVVGRSLAAYGMGIGKDSTSVSINVTRGLPNRFDNGRAFAGVRDRNHLLWREWREPEWSAATPRLTISAQTAKAHTLEWIPLIDTYPDDNTTGVLILRSTNGFSDFDASGIRDGAILTEGQSVSTATLIAVHPNSRGSKFVDSVGLECGKSYWYRVYGYRYGQDNVLSLAATADSTARGRQYNESIWAQSPQVTKSLPTKPVISASRLQVCPGDTVTITAVTGPGVMLYEWTLDGRPVAVVGTTSIIVREAGTYRLRITADGGCSVESDPVTISVLPAQQIGIAPAGLQTICSGDSVIINVTFDAPKFEWYVNGTIIPGAVGKQLVAKASGDYFVRSVTSQGCPGVSDIVRVRVRNTGLRFEPAALDFGVLGACTPSTERTIELVNTGAEAMTPTAADFPAGFALVSPAPGSVTIPPGGRIKVVLRFAPTSIGVASGQASVTALPCNAVAPVSLRGERTAALASLDRARIDYGIYTSCPGSVIKPDSTFLLQNQGTAPIRVRTPNVLPPFYLLAPQLTGDTLIPPGGTLAIRVQYRPLGADLDNGVLQDIGFPFTSAACSDTLRATLVAATYKPVAVVAPDTANVGSVYACGAGSSVDTLLTFSNNGRVPITISAVSNATVIGLPVTVEPGGSVTRRARVIVPGQPGPFSVTCVATIAPCASAVQQVTIVGTVVPLGAATNVPTVDFGVVRLCESAPQRTVTVRAYVGDSTTTTLDVDDVEINGPFTASIVRGDQLVGQQDVSLTFTPSSVGTFSDTLRVTLQPCGIVLALPVRGEARSVGANLNIVTNDFGTVETTISSQRSAQITNTGTDSITVRSVTGVAAPFNLLSASPALPAVLAPGQTLTLILQYSFTAAGRSDTLRFDVDIDGACPQVLSGMMYGTSATTGFITDVTVVIPEDLVGTPGTDVDVPVSLASSNDLRPAGAQTMSIDISYDPTVMRPLDIQSRIAGITGTVTERSPGRATIDILSSSGPLVPTQMLFRMRSAVYLGQFPSTPIRVDSVRIPKIIAKGDDGKLTIVGKCQVESRQAGRGQGFAVRIEHVGTDVVTLELTVLTHDAVIMHVHDALGALRATPLEAPMQPGRYAIRIPTSEWPSGMYLIDVQHAGLRQTVPVLIVR